jgi:hypothetical protein
MAAAVLLALATGLASVRERAVARVAEIGTATLHFLRGAGGQAWAALRAEEGAHLVALAGVLGAGAALRLHHLAGPMRCDEAFTFLNYVSKPLALELAHYSEPNNHLLNTALAHLTVWLFGGEPWAIRLPVLVVGTAAVPVSYLAVRLHFGRHAALLAAAAVAAAPELVKYSTNARGYAFVVLAFLLLLALAARLRARRRPSESRESSPRQPPPRSGRRLSAPAVPPARRPLVANLALPTAALLRSRRGRSRSRHLASARAARAARRSFRSARRPLRALPRRACTSFPPTGARSRCPWWQPRRSTCADPPPLSSERAPRRPIPAIFHYST